MIGQNKMFDQMCSYVVENYEQIKYEFDNIQTQKEVTLLKQLAMKHGFEVIPTERSVDLETKVEQSGQMTLI